MYKGSPVETISFRHLLVETMAEFLNKINPKYAKLADFCAELAVSLLQWHEEGRKLEPLVFVCTDFDILSELLDVREPVWIGQASPELASVRQILKHCSPLSVKRRWAIFIVLEKEQVRYGLFQTNTSLFGPTTFGRLRLIERDQRLLLGFSQIGHSVLEVQSASAQGIQLYLSGARVEHASPLEVMSYFVRALSTEAPRELLQPLRDFYYRIFNELTRGAHGALVAVLPVQGALMELFTDGVILPEPLDIPGALRRYTEKPDVEAVGRLQAQASLLHGMLSCDGITLIRADGVVLGYNVFVQPAMLHQPGVLGGARRRAFEALAQYVGQGVDFVLYRSQDGLLDYSQKEKTGHPSDDL